MATEMRVAIPIPTTSDIAYNRRSWPMYAAAVEAAGGAPVKIALDLSDRELADLARSCDGVVLPGSPADVDPALYGQAAVAECAAADPARERVDRVLLEECYRTGKPLLGVCFGAQSLNVWRGGSLVQDLHPTPVNHSAGARVGVAHAVVVSGGTLMSRVLGEDAEKGPAEEWRLPVNSSHHQSVGLVGEGLRASALSAQDGVVEAIEGTGGLGEPEFVLGVQWHPERSIETSATSRAIFRACIAAVAAWQKSGAAVAER